VAWAYAGCWDITKLNDLRKVDCDLEGHPTPRLPFVDVATGSLGQVYRKNLTFNLNLINKFRVWEWLVAWHMPQNISIISIIDIL